MVVFNITWYFNQCTNIFLKIGSTELIAEWESKGLSNEVIKLPDNTLAAEVKLTGKRMCVQFSGSCLKKDKVTFSHKKQ